MRKYLPYLATLFICLTLLTFCTPYNSDKTNLAQIQGKWMLVDVDHAMKIFDTLDIDYSKEQTYVIFDKDKCIQYMPDLNDTIFFRFAIQDYMLELYQDSVKVNAFGIVMLTSDSLKLMHQTSERIYKKIKE